jgi:hypothetical protein
MTLKLNSRNSEAYYNRGVVHLRQKRQKEALKDWQKCESLGNSGGRAMIDRVFGKGHLQP